MDPREFQRLAVRLASGNTAAECRSAVSRAYYAVFNVGADWLRSSGFRIGKGAAAHGEVFHCLSNSGDNDIRSAASELNDLHTLRNRADYQLDRADIEHAGEAQQIAQTSGELIGLLDAAFRGPRRAQIQAAITAWRKANGYP